ncbi:hypothetical protein OV320_2623 [Actinobacteria bacterium OV320]|jgi:hypothetical protein|nr:hypothetical protein OV320_2623 [Actinobacteria bacterium OV320]
MTTNVPEAVPGRLITYTHPVTSQVLPGIIAAIDEGNLLRLRFDGHRLTLTVPDATDKVTYLDMGTLPAPDPEPGDRFHPIPEELTGAWQRIPVHQFDTGELIALTDDHDQAVAALTAFRVSQGWEPELVDLTALELAYAAFEWLPEDAGTAWSMTPAVEGDDQAIHLHRLPVPPMEDE